MDNDLSQHLIFSIADVILKDAVLDEYDVIPDIVTEVNVNPIIVDEHKMAIRSWAVPVVYHCAYKRIFSQTHLNPDESNRLSLVVLLVNPNCSTVWNLRKKLINTKIVSMNDERRFTRLILRKHPKCADIFAHRKWLVTKTLAEQHDGTHIVATEMGEDADEGGERERLIRDELDACLMAADKYASNYSGWNHRIWCLQQLGSAVSNALVSEELEVSRRFTERHVSDHSGWHYRQFVTSLACDILHNRQPTACVTMMSDELVNNMQLINLYTGHEALWYHRRAVMSMLVKWTNQSQHNEATDATEAKRICTDTTQQMSSSPAAAAGGRGDVVEAELLFADDVISQPSTDAWQSSLATVYRRWLVCHLVSNREL